MGETFIPQYLKHDDNDTFLLLGHRFEDPSAYRRPKVRARSSVTSIIHVSDKDEVKKKTKTKAEKQLPIMKKSIDHTPHEVSFTLPYCSRTHSLL